MTAFKKLVGLTAVGILLAGGALAQTTSLEGDVKGEDGKPLAGAWIKLERTDIKGNYKVKSDKKGHWFHAGLPIGTYDISLEVDGTVKDTVKKVRSRMGDPLPINFDLQKMANAQKARQEMVAKAAEGGAPLTKEQSREMSKEEKEAIEKMAKERAAVMAKNKELNDAFNEGMENLKNKQFDASAKAFEKAAIQDPKQFVVWANMAEAYTGLAGTLQGAEKDAAAQKSFDAFGKAIEINPTDAGTHNNYALALARGGKFAEAEAELDKSAVIDPAGAGKYYFNLGAVLTNNGKLEPASSAFKKATEKDPNYAEAHYQYGVSLASKVTMTPDGKMVPPDGMREAFETYLKLAPTGPNAAGAKGMLDGMQAGIQTKYVNPDAPKKGGGTKKK